mmetsp:Transcript_16768/g.35022  ORF Transcript_16768/g.35022 Transcript_16768/m.35022 type:complete len:302 (-) Transcript_16768:260-1165(-)
MKRILAIPLGGQPIPLCHGIEQIPRGRPGAGILHRRIERGGDGSLRQRGSAFEIVTQGHLAEDVDGGPLEDVERFGGVASDASFLVGVALVEDGAGESTGHLPDAAAHVPHRLFRKGRLDQIAMVPPRAAAAFHDDEAVLAQTAFEMSGEDVKGLALHGMTEDAPRVFRLQDGEAGSGEEPKGGKARGGIGVIEEDGLVEGRVGGRGDLGHVAQEGVRGDVAWWKGFEWGLLGGGLFGSGLIVDLAGILRKRVTMEVFPQFAKGQHEHCQSGGHDCKEKDDVTRGGGRRRRQASVQKRRRR